ncbi:recombinase family protein [Fictibacillus fluitans]|uniref:Recombinase family protein n=1 Tax=Fictibacillus fluitans TaxID=3058422 RepID=A0ABT8HUH6_9BACL|nr:recombinase family protein [Fictibacillus sp. NE201]MDN4524406.1 recombinase family protein [Fictibacillus sp. NE201]
MRKRQYNFSVKELEKMKNLYEEGKNTIEIAKEFQIGVQLVNRRLKDLGIKMRKKGKLTYFSEQTIKNMWHAYINGLTIAEIAKEHRVSHVTIYRKLKTIGLNVSHVDKRSKYKYNKHFFDVIDTEHKAYWLGFIYADGCVSKNRGSYVLSIALASVDVVHLYNFKKHISSNHPIYHSTSHLNDKQFCNCKIQIYSESLCKQLILKGAIQRKSLVLKFPSTETVPNDLLPHFIRGFFDGDGCISFPKRGKYSTLSDLIPVVSFTSTKEMLEELKLHLPASKDTKVKKKLNHYELRFSGIRQAKAILDIMYKDATIYLQRKYDNYHKLIDITNEIDQKLKYRQLNELQAKIVKLLFTKYIELKSIPAVIRFMNKQGYTTLRGKQFHYTTVSHMLQQRSYTRPIRVNNKITLIIKMDTFQEVQRILCAKKQ